MTLLNYREFLAHTTKLLKTRTDSQPTIAVLILDFNGLFELDGAIGYHMVDLLLQLVAERIINVLQETDVVGCISRHQLACLLSALPNPSYAELAGHRILNTLTVPFNQQGRNLIISAHIGIAIANDTMSTEELLRQANSAMHQSINESKPLQCYTSATDTLVLSELELLSDLDKAIEESRIFLVYQPHLCIKSGLLVGAEALLRWNHPQRGVISPSSMIRVAERTGLISKLTFWVFNTAMRQCAQYRQAGLDLGVSVNFSISNLRESDLVEIVSQGLELWNVPASHVTIELTETAIMNEHIQSLAVLNCFKKMGLQIAMDDFGTGYSSMSLLQKLPIDELKIDISFVRNMMQKSDHEKIVDSIIGLAHKLGMRVVAEGVEDWPVYYRLQELGCDIVQGYLIGRPMLLDDFIAMASTYKLPSFAS